MIDQLDQVLVFRLCQPHGFLVRQRWDVVDRDGSRLHGGLLVINPAVAEFDNRGSLTRHPCRRTRRQQSTELWVIRLSRGQG
jgi:hypothetical protein